MPITANLFPGGSEVKKIYATRPAGINRQQIRETLAELAQRGRITTRDECLLEYLRELNVLSLDQIRRLLWREAKEVTAYNRLYFLARNYLLGHARVPTDEMTAWGLPSRKVYTLGLGGWMWLRTEVNRAVVTRHLRRDQVLHDLLVAELYVRLVEAAHRRGETWTATWVGEQAASYYDSGDRPIIAPDGLAIVRQQRGDKVAALPFFLEFDRSREAHGRPSSDWGRKVHGYDRFYQSDWSLHPHLTHLPAFPFVALVTHGARRLLNLAQAILKHRKEPVIYQLALWEDLLAGEDMMAAPAWLTITAEGKVIGQERAQRQPLVPPEPPPAEKKPAQPVAEGS